MILVGKPEEKRPQDLGGRIILKWILGKMGWHDLDSSGLGHWTSGRLM
jgi:hypothetical protein